MSRQSVIKAAKRKTPDLDLTFAKRNIIDVDSDPDDPQPVNQTLITNGEKIGIISILCAAKPVCGTTTVFSQLSLQYILSSRYIPWEGETYINFCFQIVKVNKFLV